MLTEDNLEAEEQLTRSTHWKSLKNGLVTVSDHQDSPWNFPFEKTEFIVLLEQALDSLGYK